MAKASSTQTVTPGTSAITTAGAYNAPAPGRSVGQLLNRRLSVFVFTSVTFAANGLIGWDPRADGKVDYPPTAVWGYYQPAGSSDHFYIIANWDPVNLNLQCWDLTDNDAGGTDTASGQFIVFAMSQ